MESGGRQTFEAAGAGAILVSTTALTVGAGALVGWTAGSLGYGVLIGAIIGVPAGVCAVYHRYRRYFAG
jgi:hypothetical protein